MKTVRLLLGCSLLALTAHAQPPVKTSGKVRAAPAVIQSASPITGVWTFVGNTGQPASSDKKVKIILDTHWMFSQMDPASNLTLFHHGGTYLLDGNRYAETIEYANESTGGLLGQTFRYDITMKGDTMLLTGNGNPWNEIWKRVR